MNKEKVISYIQEVLAKNFTGNGPFSNRADSSQIYNALMSINMNTEYSKMVALLNLIKKNTGINNKNLDDFINLIDQEAKKSQIKEPKEVVIEPPKVDSSIYEKPYPTRMDNHNYVINEETEDYEKDEPEILPIKHQDEEVEETEESAKGNIMIFIIVLLVAIIIILGIIIFLFC